MSAGQPSAAPRVALVTGSGRNLGRAIAIELARGGADLVVNVRTDLRAAEAVAEEIRGSDAGPWSMPLTWPTRTPYTVCSRPWK